MSVPTLASQPPRNVPALLAKLLTEDFTGAVEVSGTPSGTIHLRRGMVIAVDTPNAPSVETLLIRSGRIDEAAWATALTRRAATQSTDTDNEDTSDLNAVLIDLGLIGQGELEAVCIAAVYDAAFAMALQPAEGWTVHKAAVPPALVTCPGESPRTLADETTRRISTLSENWGSLAELAGARCRPAARIDPGLLTSRQQAVLLAANGRRTPATSRSSWAAGSSRRCSTSHACAHDAWWSGRHPAPRRRRAPHAARLPHPPISSRKAQRCCPGGPDATDRAKTPQKAEPQRGGTAHEWWAPAERARV
ncbi:hypothetical protein ACFQ9X_35025 [Catenulispora yoronensis]